MSHRKSVTLRCDGDGCAKIYTSAESLVNNARSEAETQGWSTLFPEGSTDYCPSCTRKGEETDDGRLNDQA
ncbi:hypothetical protein LCGC14_0983300 [marine sediment metagenome]|uniref:Uncharacterized protein n=1 Tax=marine sediment metagenome TaxID=412755 RepID=A0A0F9QR97_9ZZZZ